MAKANKLVPRKNVVQTTETLDPALKLNPPTTEQSDMENAEQTLDTGVPETTVDTTAPTQETEVASQGDQPETPTPTTESVQEAQTEVAQEAVQAPAVETETPAPDVFLDDIRNRLDNYVASMSGNVPQNVVTGGFQQRALLITFLHILSNQERAHEGLEVLLSYFVEYKNQCFNERLLHRFLSSANISAKEADQLRTLNSVFMATAEPSTRGSAIKNIGWRTVTDRLDQASAYNLTSFYLKG